MLFGFLEVFYGDHPYRYSPTAGEGLLAATREDAANWHRYIYQPEKMVGGSGNLPPPKYSCA